LKANRENKRKFKFLMAKKIPLAKDRERITKRKDIRTLTN